ncbi:MAG: sensor histidine kinase [Bacilli bacterium]
MIDTEFDDDRRRKSRVWWTIFLLLYGIASNPQPLTWLYAAVYVALVWMPLNWPRDHMIVAASLAGAVGVVVAIKVFGMPSNSAALIIPFSGFLAGSRMPLRRSGIIAGALFAAVLFVTHGLTPALWGYALSGVGIFFGVRGARMRREATLLDKVRLQELQVAHAELQQTHEELLQTTVLAMQSAAMAERAHMARDIHDGVGHHLTSLIVQLQALQFMLPDNAEAAAARLPEMLAVARQAVTDVRHAVRQWAEDDTRLGLSALRGLTDQVARSAGIACEFREPEQAGQWPKETSVTLYRVLQESLTNVLRHSGAANVIVHVAEGQGWITLTVSDNGSYTADAALTPGFGLKHMQERCRAMGGELTYGPTAPHGLAVKARLPLAKEAVS